MNNISFENLKGLSQDEVSQRQEQDGFNELPTLGKRKGLDILIGVLKEPMFLLLIACGALYLLSGEFQEALMLLSFVFVVPSRYEPTVRYYGFFSNKSRGMRKKANTDNAIPTIMPIEMSSSEAKQNWARLIQKIYQLDPLVCSKCQGPMKIISIIENFDIVKMILKHLDLWDIRNHDLPEIKSVYIPELKYVEHSDYDNSGSQIPAFDNFWS